MSGPFRDYLGNQRVIAIPPTPTRHSTMTATAVAATNLNALNIGVNPIAVGFVRCYCYLAAAYPEVTAAQSGITIQFNFVTLNAGVVTSTTLITGGSAESAGVAGAAGLFPLLYFPAIGPSHFNIAIPAGSTQVALQVNVSAIAGAPSVRCVSDWGIDITNTGAPGDIGGALVVAQGANNPNAF